MVERSVASHKCYDNVGSKLAIPVILALVDVSSTKKRLFLAIVYVTVSIDVWHDIEVRN